MIEVIYKEEKQEAKGNEGVFRIPRNIRQIGLADENYRIYVEDYVYTFLNKQAEKSQEKAGHVAVLMGETKWSKGVSYLFVRGALTVEDMEASAEHIDFTEEIWEGIYEEKAKYFPDYEIVGWFFAGSQASGELPDVFTRAHLKHFGGEKVLMLMDVSEREEAFFRYENDHMTKQRGYYIFYEKNLQMQTYMIEKNQGVQVDVPDEAADKAVRTFRKIIQEKKEEKSQEAEGKTSVFSYAATACLALAVLTVGVNFYRGYNEIPQSETGLQQSQETSAKPETSVKPETLTSISKAQPTEAVEKKAPVTVTATPQPAAKATVPMGTVQPEETEKEDPPTETVYSREADERKERRMRELVEGEGQDGTQEDVQISGQEQEQGSENRGQPAAADNVHSSYVIRPGDTLYDISVAKYGNMEIIGEICRLNGFSEDEVIYPGQVIVLP